MVDKILLQREWQQIETELQDRVESLLKDYFYQRGRNCKNPIVDFLFHYYSFSLAALKKWSPGIGIYLKGKAAERFLTNTYYSSFSQGLALNIDKFPIHRKATVLWIIKLLKNTEKKAPNLGCFGLHEWAMVYSTNKARHDVPLRMSQQKIDEFVRGQSIYCTHYDAYRFFSKPARKFNKASPTKPDMPEWEQPGCLHTNMDLYKWAYKFYPWISSKLIVDCFELALEIRKVDMQASPYNLEKFGYKPIAIETMEGKKEYVQYQKYFMERAQPLRLRLLDYFSAFAEI